MDKKPQELLDAPSLGLDEVEQLALIQEVLHKRQEELREVQHHLMNTQATMTSERVQWRQQRVDVEKEFSLKMQRIEEQWALKIQEAERQMREQQQSLQIQKDMEHEAELRIEDIARQQQALTDLSKERLEIELLRRQVTQRSDEVESRWSACQEALTKGNDALSRTQKIQEEVELRNLRLNELDVALLRREEAAILREKQAKLATEELDRKLVQSMHVQTNGTEQPIEPKPKEESHVIGGESQEVP